MNIIVERLEKIKSNINSLNLEKPIKIVAISKTFPLNHIMPLIDHGQIHFGENKVQEANVKWNLVKDKNKMIKLHLVGKLQSNKVKKAVELFDYMYLIATGSMTSECSTSHLPY